MIKAEDLRKGNLVTLDPSKDWYPKKNDYSRVVENISEDGINDHTSEYNFCGDAYEDICGIPLTPDELVKLGCLETAPLTFVIHGFMIDLKMGSRYSVSIVKDGVKTWLVEYHYVHQFQNLYNALTGQELTYTK